VENELAEDSSKQEKKGTFHRVTGAVRKFFNFLGRRHIWPGLLVGFLWSFPAPFLLSASLEFFQGLPEFAKWILFFPLEWTFWAMQVLGLGFDDVGMWGIMIWIASVFVGMFVGVVCTYCIHRIRVWRRVHDISRVRPSE
jgi:hypothetical protein